MRKVISGLFISLDGVVEAPHQWQFEDDFDDDMGQTLADTIAFYVDRPDWWQPLLQRVKNR